VKICYEVGDRIARTEANTFRLNGERQTGKMKIAPMIVQPTTWQTVSILQSLSAAQLIYYPGQDQAAIKRGPGSRSTCCLLVLIWLTQFNSALLDRWTPRVIIEVAAEMWPLRFAI